MRCTLLGYHAQHSWAPWEMQHTVCTQSILLFVIFWSLFPPVPTLLHYVQLCCVCSSYFLHWLFLFYPHSISLHQLLKQPLWSWFLAFFVFCFSLLPDCQSLPLFSSCVFVPATLCIHHKEPCLPHLTGQSTEDLQAWYNYCNALNEGNLKRKKQQQQNTGRWMHCLHRWTTSLEYYTEQ